MTLGYGVSRWKSLPVGRLQGGYIVSEGVIDATREALISFALLGIADGGHEGLAFWAGRELNKVTVFTTVIVPDAEHSAQRVFVDKGAAAKAAQAARKNQLGILCQVHSHPGSDARHSSGDDQMIFMPFEGMLSIVIPNYGIDFRVMNQACVHQFQRGEWVLCDEQSVAQNLHVAPAAIDLR
jgi:proteasome lid subunit RPN8/RPN11